MEHKGWPAFEISGWRDFVSRATEYIESGGSFAYRGQADSIWDLQPTLLRYSLSGATPQEILDLERQAEDEFRSQAHLHLGPEHLPDGGERTAWWALMQHHGAPTRLLDWTESPYVAAYFAVEKDPGRAGAVFVVDVAAVKRGVEAHYGEVNSDLPAWFADLVRPAAPDVLTFWSPTVRRSARAVAQQGLFSLSINVAAASHLSLREACVNNGVPIKGLATAQLWLFPAKVKDEILKNLRAANIAAHSLFPGLDGLGRSVGEIARIGRSGVTQTISLPMVPSSAGAYAPSVAQMAADMTNRNSALLNGPPTD